jgi:endonuclease-3
MARESASAKRERAGRIVALLLRQYPAPKTALQYDSIYQLLFAVILSAQSTDVRVNLVTPALFKRFRTLQHFADARVEDIQREIASVGLAPSKARAIKESARQLIDEFNGEVPRRLEDLIRLRGVGRKTASVVLGAGYGLAEGVVVDTHVARLSKRLGLSSKSTPEQIERDLMALIPQSDWIDFSHLLILHGRSLCSARKPMCGNCPLNQICPSAGKISSASAKK